MIMQPDVTLKAHTHLGCKFQTDRGKEKKTTALHHLFFVSSKGLIGLEAAEIHEKDSYS